MDSEAWIAQRRRLTGSPRLRRELSMRSPTYFDTHYCGMRWAPHRERWLKRISEEWTAAQASKRTANPIKARLMLLAPREHGKTEAAITFATEAICVDRSVRVLYVSAASGEAVKRVGRIKELLLSERVQADWCSAPDEGYGPFLPPKYDKDQRVQWSQNVVRVLRDSSSVDATVEGVGAGKKITGGHFDIIILDDPEDYDSVLTAEQRAKTRKWLASTVFPMLLPGGLMIMIGTRKHQDDLYGRALKNATWKVVPDVAIKKWPKKFTPVYERDEHARQVLVDWEIEGDYEVLWPEERPLKMLLTMREGMENYSNFEREMQNSVVDEEAVSFKMDWLTAATHRGKDLSLRQGPWPSDLIIVQGWDPSFVVDKKRAEKGDTDYCVGVTWAASVRTRDRYLLDISRERGSSHMAKVANVNRFYNAWKFPPEQFDLDITDYIKGGWAFAVAMEKNNAGEFLGIAAENAQDLPLVRHWTGKQVSDPFKGVPMLGSHFERGKVILPYGDVDTRHAIDPVVQEFHELGTSSHDDIVLAVWIAEVLLRRALSVFDKFVERHGSPQWLTDMA